MRLRHVLTAETERCCDLKVWAYIGAGSQVLLHWGGRSIRAKEGLAIISRDANVAVKHRLPWRVRGHQYELRPFPPVLLSVENRTLCPYSSPLVELGTGTYPPPPPDFAIIRNHSSRFSEASFHTILYVFHIFRLLNGMLRTDVAYRVLPFLQHLSHFFAFTFERNSLLPEGRLLYRFTLAIVCTAAPLLPDYFLHGGKGACSSGTVLE